MKTRYKIFGFVLVTLALASCTQSFCTNQDRSNILAAYADTEVTYDDKTMTREEKIIADLDKNGLVVPTEKYWDYMEEKIYYYAINDGAINSESFGGKLLREYTIEDLKVAKGKNYADEEITFNKSSYYACIKFAGHNDNSDDYAQTIWYNFDFWTKEVKQKVYSNSEIKVGDKTYDLTIDDIPSDGFLNSYKSQLEVGLSETTACITPTTGVFAGVQLQGKSWGDAFGRGLIEGLIEYPIAWMLDGFYHLFNLGPWGAILSILFVTIIVRLFLILVTFKSTMSQTRMQEMQPELQAIQAKYPNANTNDYQKNQMAQEQMALYKKYKVNPFSMIFVMIVQFPIFIAVWGALSGTAILKVDTLFAGNKLLAVSLASMTNKEIFKGNITAIIIFVLMAVMQILSMKLPTILNKRDAKKGPKLGKNPSQDQSQKQMNMVSNVMMIMIIIMGFTLPVGMAIYWIITALISLAQSLIIRAISKKKQAKKGYAKYKTK